MGGLTGCSAVSMQPVSSAASPREASPAVSQAQVTRVLRAVAAVQPAALESRYGGAVLEVRRAALTVRERVPTSPEPASLTGKRLLTAVPPAGEWPRWFLVALQPGGGAVPQVAVLVQDGPRDPYRVVACATLLPGATLPDLIQQDGAAQPLAADASGLVATPAEAVAGYADMLTHGGASPAAATMAPDALSAQVLAEQQAERDGVSQYMAYSAAHTPRDAGLWSLRTADGGALVVGVLSGTRTFTPRGVGVSQSLPPDLAALAGAASAPHGLEVSTAEVVVLHVPAQGTGQGKNQGKDQGQEQGRVALVAGQRGTTGVTVR